MLIKLNDPNGLTLETKGKICDEDIGIMPQLYPERTYTPTTTEQTITCPSTYVGIKSIKIAAVDYTIDENIVASNIKKGVTILGITGTYDGNEIAYQVTLSETWGNGITVYDGTSTSGTYLGTIGTTPQTVTCTTGSLYLEAGYPGSNFSFTTGSGTISRVSGSDDYMLLKITGDGTCTVTNQCFVEGTLITLEDGSQKAIEDITYDDHILCWDFDNGVQTAAKPVWITKRQYSDFYFKVVLADGTTLNIIGPECGENFGKAHRLYNVDQNKFIYATDFAAGECTIKQDGSLVQVLSCTRLDEPVYYYNLMTERCINVYANEVLTSCRLSNIYPIIDMKYVREDRVLNARESFPNLPETYFDGLRLAEQPISNEEELVKMNQYLQRMVLTQAEVPNND